MDSNNPLPKRTKNDPAKYPRVWARVHVKVRDRLEALRDTYRDADGDKASLSTVVRMFIEDGTPLMDTALRARADAISRKRGCASRADAWRMIVEAGLRALER